MRTRIAACVVVVLSLAFVAAQSDRGSVSGVVLDASGNALAGARVTLSGPERRSILSDAKGAFTLPGLAPGVYELRCEIAGFMTLIQRVTVSNTTTYVSLGMRVGRQEEMMQVSEALPVPPPPRAVVTQPAAQAAVAPQLDELNNRAPQRLDGLRSAAGGTPTPELYRKAIPGVAGGVSAGFRTEAYDRVDENGFRRVANDPLSTFSIDVDTASYANVRRFLTQGSLPPAGAVRTEELINYFRFDYPQPAADVPFSITTELTEAPWNPQHRLALIGLQGRALSERDETPRNLVFLIDVSGSMMSPDKLPLVRSSLGLLTNVLRDEDRVAIVVYAGSSGLVLPSTHGHRKDVIRQAIASLEAGGSTNGGAGIRLAYKVAREHFISGGINRVILATDGDFNVGVTSQDELIRLVEQERRSGVFLSVLGVGTGNLKDSTMEKLADRGNGNYSYLDSLHEAHKVLVREGGGTLHTIAKDVKIQVEFNPHLVKAYRLIGYENRLLNNEDFNDDTKDAGEIGAGHSVTALYEIVPAGADFDGPAVDPLKYQQPLERTRAAGSSELATVKVRYKAPDGDSSRLVSAVLHDRTTSQGANVGFASAVAEFGMLLTKSEHKGHAGYRRVAERARRYQGADREGYRAEFVRLVDRASGLD
jgi:Ca-activated chloride channel homolog